VTAPALSYQFEVTTDLRSAVQRDLAARWKWYRRMQYAYLVMPLVFIGIGLLAHRTLFQAIRENLFWIVGLPVMGFVIVPWLNRWGIRRQLRSNPMLGGTQSFALRDDGLAMETRAGSAHVRWGAILRVVESPRHFLFYYTPQCAYFLPRASIPASEIDAVRSHIRQYVAGPNELRTESLSGL
jgi:hypothetical protein